MSNELTCWCGSKAWLRNQATDATPAHNVCFTHAKDGYELIPGLVPPAVAHGFDCAEANDE